MTVAKSGRPEKGQTEVNSSVAVARAGGWWRFTKNRRHRADLSWMAMRRSSEKTLGEPLDLGGPILPVGTQVPREEWKARKVEVNYGALCRRERPGDAHV